MSKLLWMLRVAAAAFDGTRPVAGWAGPPPNVSAEEYVVDDNLRVDKKAPPALSESLLYKLSYAGVGGLVSEYGRPAGYDRVRKVPPPRTAPHRTAPHRTATHRTAPHRTAPQRARQRGRGVGLPAAEGHARPPLSVPREKNPS